MSQVTDQHSLKHNQYGDASKLNARIALRQRFGTAPMDRHRWVFDQFTSITRRGSAPPARRCWRG